MTEEHPLDRYQKDRKALQQARQAAEDIISRVRENARLLEDWEENAVILKRGSYSQLTNQISFEEWPTAEMVMNAIDTYRSAEKAVRGSFQNLTHDQQAMVNNR